MITGIDLPVVISNSANVTHKDHVVLLPSSQFRQNENKEDSLEENVAYGRCQLKTISDGDPWQEVKVPTSINVAYHTNMSSSQLPVNNVNLDLQPIENDDGNYDYII